MERPWFAAKQYGYGAGRAITWEGRVTILVSIGTILLSNMVMMWAKSVSVVYYFPYRGPCVGRRTALDLFG
ncbi:hypothetical protein [Gluconobacter cerinus]|uniref:Uncharacterized protein n=1 Tax=Gluconobacter cerinus TaxID=38307 RepID=A0AAV5NJR6_9PROT|nr:hypothetical protein [Gluconobacter cerinus]GLQ64053.1 hypothetical protein GCM10007867_28990 [Gluconobacter cerinus]